MRTLLKDLEEVELPPCFLCDAEAMMADTEAWGNTLCPACFEALGEPKAEPDWKFLWSLSRDDEDEEE